jgi:hypothetical protein
MGWFTSDEEIKRLQAEVEALKLGQEQLRREKAVAVANKDIRIEELTGGLDEVIRLCRSLIEGTKPKGGE